MSGIVIAIPDIPITIMLDQLTLIRLNIQQKVSTCTSSFWISPDVRICEGKHLVTVKCAHILLPLVTLVTSTNKSVQQDVCIIRGISKNGKQYLNIVYVGILCRKKHDNEYNCYTYNNRNNLYNIFHCHDFF